MTTAASNKLRELILNQGVNLTSDVIYIILMVSGFSFNPGTMFQYSNVSASELGAGNGYTQGGQALTGYALAEDDTNMVVNITWNSATWTATGGTIGPTPGAILYDYTSASKYVLGYIDFGGNQSQASGGIATISNITLQLS
jgi:hypothetical protein